MTHPAGDHLGVGKRSVWYGAEVEGPVCLGRSTVFIDVWPDASDLRDIQGRLEWREVTHIFLTENFDAFDQFEKELLPSCLVHPNTEVTIGTDPARVEYLLSLSWIEHAHLMVRASMDAAWVSKLRAGDQVSVGVPYDLVTWDRFDGVRSVPADYTGDKP